MQKKYVEHHADITVNAPVRQVYSLFSHFNDFPKFMHFVKEVTYYDDQHSHWVADVAGQQQWDAENENWIPDKQIGWHSTRGLDNFGTIKFEPTGTNQTKVDVFINYNPPAGIVGTIGEKLGVGSQFERELQEDLQHFARMVDQAPPGALDPASSNYLFHSQSAAAQGKTTSQQDRTMSGEHTVSGRKTITDQDITGTTNERLAGSDIDTGAIPTEPGEVPPTQRRPLQDERGQMGY